MATSKQWEASVSNLGQRDVVPLNDLIEHVYGEQCPCRPRNQDGVWVHNSRDGREILEKARAAVCSN